MSYINPPGHIPMPYIDEIDNLTKEIRRLQKIRLQYKKKIQDHCFHRNVKQIISTPKMTMRAMFEAPNEPHRSMSVKTKVVCLDCGKVLNGRRR